MAKTERERVNFSGGVSFTVLPDCNSATSIGDTTPDVSNLEVLSFANTSPVTITNFTGGKEGRQVKFKGDGHTTISNNTSIKTNTGASKLLSATKIYRFTPLSSVWYEDA